MTSMLHACQPLVSFQAFAQDMRLFTFWLTCLLFLTSTQLSQAALDISFSSPPEQLQEGEEFAVTLSITGMKADSTYYFGGSFTQPDKTNYFGYTKNNAGNWELSSSNHLNLYKVTTDGSYTVAFKPDLTSSNFKGAGEYLFKIRRFTEAGSYEWLSQSARLTLSQLSTQPTPTPTLTSTTLSPTTASELLSPQLSEVYPCPASQELEWVELFNPHQTEISLEGWKLQDAAQHTVTLQGSLPPQAYRAIELSTAVLNNSSDALALLSPSDQSIQSMSYSSCSVSSSWIWQSQWVQTATITKNATNLFTALITPTSTVKPSPTLKPTSTPKTSPTALPLSPKATITATKTAISSAIPSSSAAIPFISPVFFASTSGSVLGSTDQSTHDSPVDESAPTSPNHRPLIIGLILLCSLLLFGTGGYLLWDWYRKTIKEPQLK